MMDASATVSQSFESFAERSDRTSKPAHASPD